MHRFENMMEMNVRFRSFLHRHDEAFSTEPVKNTGSGSPLGFYHVQNVSRECVVFLLCRPTVTFAQFPFAIQITVPITKSFIQYLKTQPIMFKVFGHYQHHPLHKDAKLEFQTRPPPRRMLPPSIPISQPVRSPKFGPLPCAPSSTVLAKHDVLVWFEICELAPNGEYVPSVVEHSDDLPCRGLFLLHQGIQRRIRITIVHEPTPEAKWKEIRELVVGEWSVAMRGARCNGVNLNGDDVFVWHLQVVFETLRSRPMNWTMTRACCRWACSPVKCLKCPVTIGKSKRERETVSYSYINESRAADRSSASRLPGTPVFTTPAC